MHNISITGAFHRLSSAARLAAGAEMQRKFNALKGYQQILHALKVATSHRQRPMSLMLARRARGYLAGGRDSRAIH